MSLQMRWVGELDLERVAETRGQCYGLASKDLAKFSEGIRADGRAQAGDFLIAERDGLAVGTATSLSMNMWMRGARLSCQGVAWVGTIKTHRRGSSSPGGGVASQIMRETLRLGRERGQVVSALMPFRASFYDHFGYGIVERRNIWTLPLSIIPSGPFDSIRYMKVDDMPALSACRQRRVERGQCDIERPTPGWPIHLKKWEDGWVVVDENPDGGIRGYLAFQKVHKDGKDIVSVTDADWDDTPALLRFLHFLASLRDQYSIVTLHLPADLPLNRLLRETQLPHRLVNHAHAELRTITRMSIRVLDHARLLESIHLPQDARGSVVVSVKESEGNESRFKVDIAGGRGECQKTQQTPDIECQDRIWAGIVSGDIAASQAMELGLIEAKSCQAAGLLDVFARGPLPFCGEYF